jgi:hypothetical protein
LQEALSRARNLPQCINYTLRSFYGDLHM